MSDLLQKENLSSCKVDVADGSLRDKGLVECAVKAHYDLEGVAASSGVNSKVLQAVLMHRVQEAKLSPEELMRVSCKDNCGEIKYQANMPDASAVASDLKARFERFGVIPGKTEIDRWKFAVADSMLPGGSAWVASTLGPRAAHVLGAASNVPPVQQAQASAARRMYVRDQGGEICDAEKACQNPDWDKHGAKALTQDAKANSWNLVSRELPSEVVDKVNEIVGRAFPGSSR